MASNILSGDRRWASMRKSGMTILGKVPKPINLPSQRLENHGLDPNVEIVPKGTLTWGSRSSSATPNAWSSSTLLSPKTDGSTVSPSHHSGRPSSGGSGTRPSTAGSDRSQEPSPNAWGSNSRPSTASGLLPSNQTPVLAARPRSAETRPMVATRPRSAETRPGSSQLSRFAENSGEPAVAWGVAKTAEKLGVATSKTDEFSLSSGDFPTLGAEKKTVSYSQQGHSSQEYSDAPSILKLNEKRQPPLSGDGVVDHENVSVPRTDRNLHHDDSFSLNKDLQNNRQLAQMYENSKMASHQFDSWHGPPVHQPDGVWYRGGSFRPAAVNPGGFPGDHFVCYPHPFPPNSEAVPRPGARPSHFQPRNGEPYCPQVLPNSYILPTTPVIATRPGPYKSPGSYDGYHSHHKASFYDSAEQRISSTGVANQSSAYNQYPNHTGNFTTVDVQNGSSGDNTQIAEKQLSSSRTHVPFQGPYKVLLKPHANVDDNHSQEKDHCGSSALTHSDVDDKRRGSISKEGEHSTGIKKNEVAKLEKLTIDHQAPSKLASVNEPQPSNIGNITMVENSSRSSEGILKREPDANAVVNDRKNNTVRKNAALFEKIEGLNNKIRSGDSLSVAGELSFRQERSKQPKFVSAKPELSATSSISTLPVSEGSSANVPKSSAILLPVPSVGSPLNIINNPKLSVDSTVATGGSESKEFSQNSLKPGEAGSHVPKRVHVAHNRGDYHSKSRLDDQPAIGWTRESSGRDSSVVSIEKKVAEEAILTSSSDSLDRQAERSKLKEMAVQRAKQLKEEEEERTREQKAKALAKLEELNRRSAAQIMKQKSNDASSPKNNVQHQEDSGVDNDSSKDIVVTPPGDILVENSDTSLQVHNDEHNKHGPSASQHSETPVVPLGNELNATETIAEDIVSSQSHVIIASKHKQMGFRRRHKALSERSTVERQIMSDNLSSKHLDDVGDERNQDVKPLTSEKKESSRNLGEVSTHDGDSSLQHKRKNSRNSRNKSKDEGSVGSGLSSSTHSHENVEEHVNESSKSHPAASVTETSSVHSQTFSNYTKSQDSGDSTVQHHKEPSSIIEEAHGRMSNQWKQHQPSRRPARNQQANRPLDKVHGNETVIWAPVKPANKNDQSEEISHSTTVGSNSQPLQRNEHDMHSGTRTKRAEMERYVPKPVAKELLQQENTRKPSNNIDQAASGDITEKSYSDSKGTGMGKYDGSSIGRTDFIADTKNGVDNKPSRRGRAHASWRQRSSESTLPLQNSNESLNSSDATKPLNKPSDQHPPLPEQLKPDGWESSSNSVAKDSVVAPSLTKDQGVASRQKRQQAHRTTGNHYGNPDGKSDKSGFVAPILDINETDTRNCVKGDNKDGAGEYIRSHSHWKPKSQAISHNPQQQTRGNAGLKSEMVTSPGFGSDHSSNENNSTPTLKDVSSVITDVGHQDSTGAKMGTCNPDLSEESMHFPKPVIQTNAALHPGDINAQQENHISSQRRHGHRGGRFSRGQEATYRSSDLIQMNEDQRKNNSHFGYQPIGSFNKTSNLYQSHSNNDQETQGHQASRQRYKERVQTQTRNPSRFVRRNTGISAHVSEE